MDIDQLHFAYPLYFLTLAVIPVIWIAYYRYQNKAHSYQYLENFIDKHLLPHLLIKDSMSKRKSYWKTLVLWSLMWCCFTFALAAPRWNSREIETFSKDQSLVVLLDLSESMNATDLKPSRLVRAKQKIEDLINASQGLKIGLIAFAADPHMITPITEDKETIRYLLPTLQTDMMYIQGSRLSTALEMANNMLAAEPGINKAILVISDGGFEDSSAMATAKKVAQQNIVIHVMAAGTVEGAPLNDAQGNIIRKNGSAIISKLDQDRLQELSQIGRGFYLQANHINSDETAILASLEQQAQAQMQLGKKNTIWEENFYLMVLPALPILLWWMKRGYIFAFVALLSFSHCKLEAADFFDYFKNSEQIAHKEFERQNYENAADYFQDSYRKGVALYKAGDYAAAEEMFRESNREEVAASAGYNLANAQVQQEKFNEAIATYEEVLKKFPDHKKAQENLELIKKLKQQQQKQQGSQSEKSNKQGEQKTNQEQSTDRQKEQNNQQSESQNDGEKNSSSQQSDSKNKKDEKDHEKQNNENKKDSSENEPSSQQPKNDQQQTASQSNRSSSNDKELNAPQNPLPNDHSENATPSQSVDKTIPDNALDNELDDNSEKKQPNSDDTADEQNITSNESQQNPKGHEESDTNKDSEKSDGHAKALANKQNSQLDQDADFWLNQINNDPKEFMKNKFYIESKRNGTREGIDPW